MYLHGRNSRRLIFEVRISNWLSSSPAIWQRFIEQVLAGLGGTCVIMDDLLVGGSNNEGHLKNLKAVLGQFQKYGLRVKLPQYVFMGPSVICFGFHFSEKGI